MSSGARDAEFDPGHTMSPVRPGDPERAPDVAASTFSDGATPALPLEFALNSSSPTSSDGVVVAVVTDPNARETTVAQQSLLGGGQPNYAALIDPKDSARQMRCLAEAIYFESRSEPEAGQAAVAQVVLNRVRSGIYPTTVCGVVYQDRNRPFACQFSFACEGKSLRIEEPGPGRSQPASRRKWSAGRTTIRPSPRRSTTTPTTSRRSGPAICAGSTASAPTSSTPCATA